MKQSLFIGIMATSDIAVSFAMQLVILTSIGVGRQMDALYASMVAPSLVLGIVQSSLMHVLVPLLTVSSSETFRRDAWALFLLIGVIMGALTCLLCAAAPLWVPIIVPGFDAASRQLVVQLTRVQMIASLVIAELAVLTAVYHARNKFLWPEMTPLLGDCVGLALLIWALPRFGVFSVVWLNVSSVVVQALLLISILGRYEKPDFSSANLLLAWKRIRPLLVGAAYYKTDAVLDRALSSLSRTGGFSLLYIGQQIYSASNQIVCKAMCAPIVPKLSERASAGDWPGFRHTYRAGLLRVAGLLVTVYILFLAIGERALKLIIGHSHVTAGNVHLLWVLMALGAGTLIGGPVGQILCSILFATGDTTSPTRVGAISYTIGIAVRLILFRLFGIAGLAVAISTHFIVSSILLVTAIRKNVPVVNSSVPA